MANECASLLQVVRRAPDGVIKKSSVRLFSLRIACVDAIRRIPKEKAPTINEETLPEDIVTCISAREKCLEALQHFGIIESGFKAEQTNDQSAVPCASTV